MHPVVPLEKVDAASDELEFTILLLGFSEAIVIPRLLDAIGLDVEELVAVGEDGIIAAGRDLDTTLSLFALLSSSPLWSSLSS